MVKIPVIIVEMLVDAALVPIGVLLRDMHNKTVIANNYAELTETEKANIAKLIEEHKNSEHPIIGGRYHQAIPFISILYLEQ